MRTRTQRLGNSATFVSAAGWRPCGRAIAQPLMRSTFIDSAAAEGSGLVRSGPGVSPAISGPAVAAGERRQGVRHPSGARPHELIPRSRDGRLGFNGSIPGPTIQVTEGDHVRLNVATACRSRSRCTGMASRFPRHGWYARYLQDAIPPGGKFVYDFTLNERPFFYHSHMAMQEMMGLIGLFIIHPRRAHSPRVDRDFGIILQEWALLPSNTIPNSLAMEFNWLTINGKAGPATTPLVVKLGERVRIRVVNLGMDHHPMHMHGHQFYVTGTEGGRIRTTAVIPRTLCSSVWRRPVTSSSSPTILATGTFTATCRIT